MAQAVSRWPLTAKAHVRARGQSMWDLWWTEWHWAGFLRVLRFPLQISFHHCSIFIYHRPIRCAIALTKQHTITTWSLVRGFTSDPAHWLETETERNAMWLLCKHATLHKRYIYGI
jgi:hypothetical protein